MSILRGIEKNLTKAGQWFRGLDEAINSRPYSSWKNQLEPMGISGTRITGQFFNEEQYMMCLHDPWKRYETYQKMRLGDPAVNLSMAAYELPVISAKWHIVMDDTNEDGEEIIDKAEADKIKSFIHANFFEHLKKRRTWTSLLREILHYKQFGNCCFELTEEVIDGQVWIKDIAFRHPRTYLWDWDYKTDSPTYGQLLGVSQYNTQSQISPKGRMDFENLLIFVNERQGDNMEGIGVCRYQYNAWKSKDVLNRLMMVGFERYLADTPVLQPKEGSTVYQAEQKAAQDFIQSIRSMATSGGIIPAGWEKIPFTGNFQGFMVALHAKESYNKEIFWVTMSESAMLGLQSSGHGSYGQAKSKEDKFSLYIQAVIQEICDQFNAVLIPRLVNKNFNVQIYPRLEAEISETNVKEWFDEITELVDKGIIPTSKALQEMVLLKLGMPKKDIEEYLKESGQPTDEEGNPLPDETRDDVNNVMSERRKKSNVRSLSKCSCDNHRFLSEHDNINTGDENDNPETSLHRNLTKYEEQIGDVKYFTERKDFLVKLPAKFKREISPTLEKQKDAIAEIAKGVNSPESLKSLLAAEVPYQDEYVKVMEKLLYETAFQGLMDVAKLHKVKPSEESLKDIKLWSEGMALKSARKSAEDLKIYIVGKIINNNFETPKKKVQLSEVITKAYRNFINVFAGR